MSTRIGETEQPLLARIEKTETAFLAEFHKWASPVEMRQRTRAAVRRVTEVETEALTGRVKKLETSWVVLPRNQSQVAQLPRTGGTQTLLRRRQSTVTIGGAFPPRFTSSPRTTYSGKALRRLS